MFPAPVEFFFEATLDQMFYQSNPSKILQAGDFYMKEDVILHW